MRINVLKMKKSQSALEYLTTYGWALIAIAVAIAALTYFGVFNPKKLLPDRCIFKAGFVCEAYKIGSDGTFNLRLKNNLGEIINVTNITIESETVNIFSCTTPPSYPSEWAPDLSVNLAWGNCNAAQVGFTSGNKGKVLVKIAYYNTKFGPSYSNIASGEVLAAII